jgi:hypothetical protein
MTCVANRTPNSQVQHPKACHSFFPAYSKRASLTIHEPTHELAWMEGRPYEKQSRARWVLQCYPPCLTCTQCAIASRGCLAKSPKGCCYTTSTLTGHPSWFLCLRIFLRKRRRKRLSDMYRLLRRLGMKMCIVHITLNLRIEVVTVPKALIKASLVAVSRSRTSIAPLACKQTTKRCTKAPRSLGVES